MRIGQIPMATRVCRKPGGHRPSAAGVAGSEVGSAPAERQAATSITANASTASTFPYTCIWRPKTERMPVGASKEMGGQGCRPRSTSSCISFCFAFSSTTTSTLTSLATGSNDASRSSNTSAASPPAMTAEQSTSQASFISPAPCPCETECRSVLGDRSRCAAVRGSDSRALIRL